MSEKTLKLLKRVLLIVIVYVALLPKIAHAEENVSGDWEYRVSSSEATLTKYNGASLNIEIPSMIDGYPVTGVGSRIFEESMITEVEIPASIEKIESRAFADCKYLTKIVFNAKNCKAYYFRSEMDSHIFVNAGKFSDSLTVIFGNTVEYIPACLFEASEDSYAHVTNVSISDNVEEIGDWAFANCFDLETVNFGNGVRKIDGEAFRDCNKLTSIIIPEVTEYIGYAAFKNCKYLQNIEFNARDCEVSYFRSMMEDMHVFVNAGKFSDSLSVRFGPRVEKVPAAIFEAPYESYAHVTSVFVPSGVKEIGAFAFNNCRDLRTITIEGKNTTIPTDSFNNPFTSCDSSLTFSCMHNSMAEQYAKEAHFHVKYLDARNSSQPRLNKTKLLMTRGESKYLIVKNAKGTIKWKSSNKKVATVSAKGLVKAKKKGKAIITAKVNGKTLKCTVTVK